ncbi:MAG TPA: DJ-1/PfpI family protein [candidate division Zixibacteria bacterium]|nr:DJ-1/PfpI family protein [candidate division Zixibacteria bacterium]
MKIFLFLYDKFSDFEIVQALLILRENVLTTVGFEKGLVKSIGQLKVEAEISIEELIIDEVDLLLIPGGEPKHFIRNKDFNEKIKVLNKKLQILDMKGKIIAAICGGPTFLANAGILDNKTCTASISEDERIFYKNSNLSENDFVIDGNILTAQGQAFTEFAVQLAKLCNTFETEKEMEEAIKWFRNVKD